MKRNGHLASIEGLHLKHAIERVATLYPNRDSDRKTDELELLIEEISSYLIEPTKRLVTEWVNSIQSGNDSSVITTARISFFICFCP